MLSRPVSPTTSPNVPAFSGVTSRPAPTSNCSEKGSPLAQYMQLAGARVSFARNAEIFGENEPADYVYSVISGSVRTCKILTDGRRQISGFYLPGDVFGLEFGDDHALSAEAITASRVVVVKRRALNMLVARDPSVGRDLFAITGRELRRAHDHLLLLV